MAKGKGRKKGKNKKGGSGTLWVTIGAVVVAGLYFWIQFRSGSPRSIIGLVSSPEGDFVLVNIQKSSDGKYSTSWKEFTAFDLMSGDEINEVSTGSNAKILGVVGDDVWLDFAGGNAALVSFRTGTWLVNPKTVTQVMPQIDPRWQFCRPNSDSFNGPIHLDTGGLCLIGNNGMHYLLGVDGKLEPLLDEQVSPPVDHCPKPGRQWWVGNNDECLDRAPNPKGGYSLVSTKGWEGPPMTDINPLRGQRGYVERFGEQKLIVVQYKPPGSTKDDRHACAIDEEGNVVWTLSAAKHGHEAKYGPTFEANDRVVVIMSGGNRARVSVFDVNTGKRIETHEL